MSVPTSQSVEVLFPQVGSATVQEVVAATDPARTRLRFADSRALDFLEVLSRHLLAPAVSRAHPELAALGSFLRRRHLRRLTEAPQAADTARHPVGRVLHFPPANVDTVFLYSWALSMAAGNTNVVRLSPRAGDAAAAIVETLRAAAAEADPAFVSSQVLVSYVRDERTTEALSAATDLRVVWGGDASVQSLRRVPLPATSRDLSFPDRSSLAVISAQAWLDSGAPERQQLAQRVLDDTTLFDQAACSSAKTIVWVGAEAQAAQAADELTEALAAASGSRGLADDPAMAIERRVATYGLAATGRATRLRYYDKGVTSVDLAPSVDLNRQWLGSAVLAHTRVDALDELISRVTRTEQTLAYFGLKRTELEALSERLGSAGVHRIVPLGTSLHFHPVWDGYDLLAEFSRLRVII